MRYSFISEGESHYICMHAETAMYLRLKGEGFAEQCLQNRILFRETTEETVDQEFSEEKLFLDLSYLQVMEEGVAELLINAMQKWISCNCEVYLIKTEPELYEGLKPELECLRAAGHLTVKKDAYHKIIIRFTGTLPEERNVNWIKNTVHHIHKENIMLLREETPSGKKIPVVRLLAQEENCLIYFFTGWLSAWWKAACAMPPMRKTGIIICCRFAGMRFPLPWNLRHFCIWRWRMRKRTCMRRQNTLLCGTLSA